MTKISKKKKIVKILTGDFYIPPASMRMIPKKYRKKPIVRLATGDFVIPSVATKKGRKEIITTIKKKLKKVI